MSDAAVSVASVRAPGFIVSSLPNESVIDGRGGPGLVAILSASVATARFYAAFGRRSTHGDSGRPLLLACLQA
jgi:hypothetical protein